MEKHGLPNAVDFSEKISTREPGITLPDGGMAYVRVARYEEIEILHELTVSQIGPEVASLEIMQDVYRHNPETLWTLFRSPNEDRSQAQLVGYYGFLHLNEEGYEALKARTLKPIEPDLRLLVPGGERPAAVYVWAIVARKLMSWTIPLVGKGLGIKRYGSLPFYATAGTLGGLKGLQGYGFKGSSSETGGLGELFHFHMPGEAERAAQTAA